ncbi:luciferin 4-monooxygenase-like [Anopheles albimanus]|uniref:luciferin 4-monooxygenase-like n=1 Tax=Anopheles albimanus TaxID=7167 RepID=UPI00163FAE54|nr:luciferin 4-monooxygenase-like [Anopheles albimanus]
MVDDERHIVRGPPAPEDLTLGTRSVGELFLKVFRQSPTRVAIIDGVTGREHTYGELLERSLQLAAYLHDHGVGTGDVVAIVSENRVEYPITIVALFLIGSSAALFNPGYTSRELTHALTITQPKLVFVSAQARGALYRACRSTKHLTSIINYDAYDRSTSYADCLRRSSRSFRAPSFMPAPVADLAGAVALIVLSSGTTGLPKGVLISQANVMATLANFRYAMEKQGPADRSFVEILPWYHVAGGILMLSVLSANLRKVALAKFEPRTYLRCVERYRPTVLNIVPPIAVFLAKHPMVDEYDLSSVEMITCGAAPLSKEVEELIYARLGTPGLRIRQGYGMSETTQAITFYDSDQPKPGTIGGLRPGQLGKVIDPDTGRALGPHQRGELCFKGSLIMKGYIGAESPIDADGWLHTGDIGYYDEDQDFFIVDRLKELIKYKAFQVPPAELEAVLLSHPEVKDAAVIGVPDDRAGELPRAYVVRKEDSNVSPQELIAFVEQKVSSEKRLRGGLQFIGEIPKTASGKILRRALRDLATSNQSKL